MNTMGLVEELPAKERQKIEVILVCIRRALPYSWFNR